jgi:hypothetical protein
LASLSLVQSTGALWFAFVALAPLPQNPTFRLGHWAIFHHLSGFRILSYETRLFHKVTRDWVALCFSL